MGKNTSKGGDKPVAKAPGTVLMLAIGDTTWRMFVPTVGCLLLGRLADDTWHIKPFGMVAGIIIGATITVFLIKRQLEKEV